MCEYPLRRSKSTAINSGMRPIYGPLIPFTCNFEPPGILGAQREKSSILVFLNILVASLYCSLTECVLAWLDLGNTTGGLVLRS